MGYLYVLFWSGKAAVKMKMLNILSLKPRVRKCTIVYVPLTAEKTGSL